MLLAVDDLTVRYGAVEAVRSATLHVEQGGHAWRMAAMRALTRS